MMTKRVAITGSGLISSLGDSAEGLHSRLCRGETGIRHIGEQGFEHFNCRQSGALASFKPELYLEGKTLRPLDRTGQMVAAAAKLALRNSGWTSEKLKNHDVGLILGTMFGSVHTISEFDRHSLVEGPSYVSPMDFANTVINAAAGQTAIWHKLRGINSTISCGLASGLMALGYAADLIRNGQQSAVLAGGADEFCFESFCGFERTGLLCRTTEAGEFPIPFDARRNGFALAEGAAFLMLEEWEFALTRGAPIVGEIRGHANANNPVHGKQDGGFGAVARAMQSATDDAAILPSQINCISASASGSVAADRQEASAIRTFFNGDGEQIPITAIKSMVGESLGASGVLQAIDLLETMHTGVLPPIQGLQDTAPDLPVLNFCREPQHMEVRSGLINSIGLDGHACAMVISAPSAAS